VSALIKNNQSQWQHQEEEEKKEEEEEEEEEEPNNNNNNNNNNNSSSNTFSLHSFSYGCWSCGEDLSMRLDNIPGSFKWCKLVMSSEACGLAGYKSTFGCLRGGREFSN
jgi:hypothetical protein